MKTPRLHHTLQNTSHLEVTSPSLRPKVYDAFDTPEGPTINCTDDICHTKQSFAEECDINLIMQRAELTGIIDEALINQREAAWADVSDIDFQDMQNKIASANEAFATLSATIRNRFHNDPKELLTFLSERDNIEEAV